MNANVKMINGKSVLTLKFQRPEIKLFENKFKELGLEKATTVRGFDKGLKFDFWREEGVELKQFIKNSLGYSYSYSSDNINGAILDSDKRINIGVFRVVPDVNNEIVLPIDEILSVYDCNKIIKNIAQIYATLLNVVTDLNVNIEIQSSKLKVEEKNAEPLEALSDDN